MTKKKYYVVWKGRKTGIFYDWSQCKTQIEQFPGALYKSYSTEMEARIAFQNGFEKRDTNVIKEIPKDRIVSIDRNAICVDAACSGNPGVMEYRCVDMIDKKELFHGGPYRHGTNNLGEFLAIIHGISWMIKNKQNRTIYTDSMTALAWFKKKKINTTLVESDDNKKLFDDIQKSLVFLHKFDLSMFKILKWDTEHWGEIPADFGRK